MWIQIQSKMNSIQCFLIQLNWISIWFKLYAIMIQIGGVNKVQISKLFIYFNKK
jgi:hypothetical protein